MKSFNLKRKDFASEGEYILALSDLAKHLSNKPGENSNALLEISKEQKLAVERLCMEIDKQIDQGKERKRRNEIIKAIDLPKSGSLARLPLVVCLAAIADGFTLQEFNEYNFN